jgi:hypothetical protein
MEEGAPPLKSSQRISMILPISLKEGRDVKMPLHLKPIPYGTAKDQLIVRKGIASKFIAEEGK